MCQRVNLQKRQQQPRSRFPAQFALAPRLSRESAGIPVRRAFLGAPAGRLRLASPRGRRGLVADHLLDMGPKRLEIGQLGVLGEHLGHLDAPLRAARQTRETPAEAPIGAALGDGQQPAETVLRLPHADGGELGARSVGEARKLVAQRDLDGDFLAARGALSDLAEELEEEGRAQSEQTQHGGLVELGGGEERAVRAGARARVDEAGVAEERLDAVARVVRERVGESGLAGEVAERGVGAVAKEDLAEGGGGGLAGEHEGGEPVGVLEVEDAARRGGERRRGGGGERRGEGAAGGRRGGGGERGEGEERVDGRIDQTGRRGVRAKAQGNERRVLRVAARRPIQAGGTGGIGGTGGTGGTKLTTLTTLTMLTMLTTLLLLLLLFLLLSLLLLLLLARSVGAEALHARLVAVEDGVHQHGRSLSRLVTKRSTGFQ